MTTILLLTVVILAGCGRKNNKPEFEVVPNDDNTITITADNAGAGSMVGGATISISDGQVLVVDSTMTEKSGIGIKLFVSEGPQSIDASADDVLHANDEPALTLTVDGPGTAEYPLSSGEYSVFVSVEKKSTGVITLSTK